MKRLIALLVFTLSSSIGVPTLSSAADDMAAPDSKTVKGDVLKIEGQFYTVHDTAGHEVRLHMDKTTHPEGTSKTGETVQVYVTDKGHARSIYKTHTAGEIDCGIPR
jgi:hypothetical protein